MIHFFTVTGRLRVEADDLVQAREKIAETIGAQLCLGDLQLTGDNEPVNTLAMHVFDASVRDENGVPVILTFAP